MSPKDEIHAFLIGIGFDYSTHESVVNVGVLNYLYTKVIDGYLFRIIPAGSWLCIYHTLNHDTSNSVYINNLTTNALYPNTTFSVFSLVAGAVNISVSLPIMTRDIFIVEIGRASCRERVYVLV